MIYAEDMGFVHEMAAHAPEHWSVHFLVNVIFITEWDPPAVDRCNLEGSPPSICFIQWLLR